MKHTPDTPAQNAPLPKLTMMPGGGYNFRKPNGAMLTEDRFIDALPFEKNGFAPVKSEKGVALLKSDGTLFPLIKEWPDMGSEGRTLYAFRFKNEVIIRAGCFLGTIPQFIEAVRAKHGNNKYAQAYFEAIEELKSL